jgi:hypothetical protein
MLLIEAHYERIIRGEAAIGEDALFAKRYYAGARKGEATGSLSNHDDLRAKLPARLRTTFDWLSAHDGLDELAWFERETTRVHHPLFLSDAVRRMAQTARHAGRHDVETDTLLALAPILVWAGFGKTRPPLR